MENQIILVCKGEISCHSGITKNETNSEHYSTDLGWNMAGMFDQSD